MHKSVYITRINPNPQQVESFKQNVKYVNNVQLTFILCRKKVTIPTCIIYDERDI